MALTRNFFDELAMKMLLSTSPSTIHIRHQQCQQNVQPPTEKKKAIRTPLENTEHTKERTKVRRFFHPLTLLKSSHEYQVMPQATTSLVLNE